MKLKIYNLLDDIEHKLSNRNKSNYTNYNIDFTGDSNTYNPMPRANNLSNIAYYQPLNPNQSPVIPQNLTMNQSTDLDIRKIIKEEFISLILPYQTEVNNNINILKKQYDNLSNDYQNVNNSLINCQNNNVNREDILKEIKNILTGNITSNEYNKKIGDLEQLISSNINNMNLKNNSFQDLINKYNNEVKNI